MNNKIKLITVVTISSVLLTACKESNTNTQVNNSDANNAQPSINNNASALQKLQNTQWKLVSVITPAQEIPNELYFYKEKAKLSFSDVNNQSTVAFDVGCNLKQGLYRVDKNVLITDGISSTKKYCDELDKSEKFLEKTLSQQNRFSINQKGNTTLLTITSANGDVLTWLKTSDKNTQLINQLKRYKWQLSNSTNKLLNNYITSSVSSVTPAMNQGMLRFNNSLDNKLTYNMGCNDFSGNYSLDNATLKTSAMMVTKKSCMNIMYYENELNRLMNLPSELSYNDKNAVKILKQTFKDDAKTSITWSSKYKRFTAQVDGKLTKRNSQGQPEVLKQQSKTVKNIFISDKTDCPGIDASGLMHMALSNFQQTSCVYHGDDTATYTVYIPDRKETYHYDIKLTETFD